MRLVGLAFVLFAFPVVASAQRDDAIEQLTADVEILEVIDVPAERFCGRAASSATLRTRVLRVASGERLEPELRVSWFVCSSDVTDADVRALVGSRYRLRLGRRGRRWYVVDERIALP